MTGPGPQPHDPPRPAELAALVRHALAELSTAPDPAYELRLITRALEIIERELDLAPDIGARYRAVLAALGIADTGALANAVRRGVFDERLATVSAALRPVVRDKLSVSNPGYLDRGVAPEPLRSRPDTAETEAP